MKIQNRLLAFLTALLLLLPLTGCLVSKETDRTAASTSNTGAVPAPDGANAAPSDAPVFDGKAIAIELGDIEITAAELENAFNQYVSYFAYGYGLDEESLDQFMRMTEEWMIEYHIPEWKAKELGVTLTAEQEAEYENAAHEQVEQERADLLCYFGDPEGLIEDVTLLSDEQIEAALAEIDSELKLSFGEGYTFDDYLADRYDDIFTSLRVDALNALLREQFVADLTADSDAIDKWYDETLAEQKTQFTDDPDEYLSIRNLTSLNSTGICLYTPKDAALLELVCIRCDDTDADRIAENTATLAELEAEYGALKLNEKDEARQAEIETAYAALKEETETLKAKQGGKAKETADRIRTELDGGMSFEDAMETYNEHEDGESGRYELTVFLHGEETAYPKLAEAAADLAVGAYSEPVLIDGAYYIIRLAEQIPEGAVDRAAIEDEIAAYVSDTIRDAEWEAQSDAWLEEAKAAAVYHRDAYYDALIAMYLG